MIRTIPKIHVLVAHAWKAKPPPRWGLVDRTYGCPGRPRVVGSVVQTAVSLCAQRCMCNRAGYAARRRLLRTAARCRQTGLLPPGAGYTVHRVVFGTPRAATAPHGTTARVESIPLKRPCSCGAFFCLKSRIHAQRSLRGQPAA